MKLSNSPSFYYRIFKEFLSNFFFPRQYNTENTVHICHWIFSKLYDDDNLFPHCHLQLYVFSFLIKFSPLRGKFYSYSESSPISQPGRNGIIWKLSLIKVLFRRDTEYLYITHFAPLY